MSASPPSETFLAVPADDHPRPLSGPSTDTLGSALSAGTLRVEGALAMGLYANVTAAEGALQAPSAVQVKYVISATSFGSGTQCYAGKE